jgi:hypothetical protein
MGPKAMRYAYLLSSLLSGAWAAVGGLCPPLGPVLPAPKAPSNSLYVQAAVAVLKEALFNGTAPLNGSSVSVGIQSIHEADPLFEFHYTPPKFGANGVKKVDSDTVYRLASTSKMFAVLAILQIEGMDLNDPITKYLPELQDLGKQARKQNNLWTVNWDDVTLGALSSHLGAPADCKSGHIQTHIEVESILNTNSGVGSSSGFREELDRYWIS